MIWVLTTLHQKQTHKALMLRYHKNGADNLVSNILYLLFWCEPRISNLYTAKSVDGSISDRSYWIEKVETILIVECTIAITTCNTLHKKPSTK